MSDHYAICYISRADESLSGFDIKTLLELSVKGNNKAGIRGVLLYRNSNFLQVLEGKKVELQNVYSKICNDGRHNTLIEIFSGAIESPLFANYNSKFSVLDSKQDLISLKEYFRRSDDFDGESSVMMELLLPFIEPSQF